MKKFILISILFILSISTHASQCRVYSGDPFEPNYLFKTGKFKGQCLDTKIKRSLKLLSDLEREYYSKVYDVDLKDRSNLVIANFGHNNQYWLALIPHNKKSILRSILQIEYFPPEALAAHTQLRFDFDPAVPIKLIGQNEENKGQVIYINSVINSFEGTIPTGEEKFNIFKSIGKNYLLSARMISLEQTYNYIVEQQHHKNQQLLLNFNEEERWNLFNLVMLRSAAVKNRVEKYRLITNNCTTEIYDLFEIVRPSPFRIKMERGQIQKIKSRNPLSSFPVSARMETLSRKILDQEMETLDEEFKN